ncbi:hypothetical protein GWI89_15445 [Proteus sp. G4417]|nr:hypothetical protein [Proteus sp. G4417]
MTYKQARTEGAQVRKD